MRCTALSRWRSASDILLNMGLAVLVEVGLAVLEGVPDGVAVLLTEVVGDGDPATERKKYQNTMSLARVGLKFRTEVFC